MDFTIDEYNEEVNLTIIEDGEMLDISITEVVESVDLFIGEYNGADGPKGDMPGHEWNGTSLRLEKPDNTWGPFVDLKGPKGDASEADKNYVHDQSIPSKEWVIAHPLNKKVSVTITDTAGTVVEGQVTINDGNKVVIEFNFPFSGEAILN